jgi:small subunit ribosomal protein S17
MKRGIRKTKNGIVVSNKMKKTVVVEVVRTSPHPLYDKVMQAYTRYKVHDEENKCNVGDMVEIMETKPISRDKRWRVMKVLGKGKLRGREMPKKREAKKAEIPEAVVGSQAGPAEARTER